VGFWRGKTFLFYFGRAKASQNIGYKALRLDRGVTEDFCSSTLGWVGLRGYFLEFSRVVWVEIEIFQKDEWIERIKRGVVD
jgi:hypothetical protein